MQSQSMQKKHLPGMQNTDCHIWKSRSNVLWSLTLNSLLPEYSGIGPPGVGLGPPWTLQAPLTTFCMAFLSPHGVRLHHSNVGPPWMLWNSDWRVNKCASSYCMQNITWPLTSDLDIDPGQGRVKGQYREWQLINHSMYHLGFSLFLQTTQLEKS